jgi:hypothetical protein
MTAFVRGQRALTGNGNEFEAAAIAEASTSARMKMRKATGRASEEEA